MDGVRVHPPDDRGAADVDVAFRIASVSKMMTATALLVLCDQGHCRLDDAVGAYLDGDVLDRFRDSDQRPYAGGLSLRQLLDHTSGLPNYFLQPVVMDAVLHGDGRRRFIPADLLDLAAGSTPLSSPPGAVQVYTDTGFLLAALIIESLTLGPLQDAYRTLVLDPAGMADTWLESSSDPPRRATVAQHGIQGQDITGMDPTVDWSGGGLVSTAADLGAFLRALAHGRLVTSSAWSAMTRWRSGPVGLLRRLWPGPRPIPVPGGAGRWPSRGVGRVRVLVSRAGHHNHRHGEYWRGGSSPTARGRRAGAGDRNLTHRRRQRGMFSQRGRVGER